MSQKRPGSGKGSAQVPSDGERGSGAPFEASTETLPLVTPGPRGAPQPAVAGAGAAAASAGPAGPVGAAGRPRFDPRAAGPRPQAPRRARLALKRVDPWSVFVLSLLISLFLGVVLLVAVLVLYSLLESMGVLASVDSFARDLQLITADQSILGKGRVMGVAAVIAAIDVVLLTVFATLFAFLYNLCASLTGGIDVTLAERD